MPREKKVGTAACATSSPDDPSPTVEEQNRDPETWIALIFRVLDRPHRTLCLIAVLALIVGGVAQILQAPAVAGLPVWLWSTMISGGSFISAAGLRYWITRKIDARTTDPQLQPVPGHVEASE
ncbi:MAG TPA: hypothetical protein VFV66_17585 [Nonomuraea sp.]|nr:hypothetical protein [Nonomuraea sp.]